MRSSYQSLIYLSQDVQKSMLGKEWLAKVDIETSTPYLLVCSVICTTTLLNELLLKW